MTNTYEVELAYQHADFAEAACEQLSAARDVVTHSFAIPFQHVRTVARVIDAAIADIRKQVS